MTPDSSLVSANGWPSISTHVTARIGAVCPLSGGPIFRPAIMSHRCTERSVPPVTAIARPPTRAHATSPSQRQSAVVSRSCSACRLTRVRTWDLPHVIRTLYRLSFETSTPRAAGARGASWWRTRVLISPRRSCTDRLRTGASSVIDKDNLVELRSPAWSRTRYLPSNSQVRSLLRLSGMNKHRLPRQESNLRSRLRTPEPCSVGPQRRGGPPRIRTPYPPSKSWLLWPGELAICGGCRIRTCAALLTPTTVFKTAALPDSANPPNTASGGQSAVVVEAPGVEPEPTLQQSVVQNRRSPRRRCCAEGARVERAPELSPRTSD